MSDEVSRLLRRIAPEFPHLDAAEIEDEEDHAGAISPGFAEVQALVRERERPALFGYQRDLVESATRSIERRESALVGLPTGAGKTRTAAVALLTALSAGTVSRVVWMAPSVELVDQAVATMADLWRRFGPAPDLVLARSVASFNQATCSVLFTTPQSVYAGLRRRSELIRDPDVVVFDEAHQLGAATFREAVGATSRDGEVPILGLSATPGRNDALEMGDLVDLFEGRLLTSDRLRPNPVQVLQRMGVLAQLKFSVLRPGAEGSEPERIVETVRLLQELKKSKSRSLVFSSSVAGSRVVAAAARSTGLSAESLDNKTPLTRRRAVLEKFAAGKLDAVSNYRLLATGYDCPAVSDVVIMARIGSPILFEQIVGRGARGPRTGGSRVARIWQFDDHLSLHGLPQSYYRYREFDWGVAG